MKKYIGFKMIQAKPMTKKQFEASKITTGVVMQLHLQDERPDQEGYKVVYPDGYISWSPKEVFEAAYMEIGDNYTITQENVDNFIEYTHTSTVGQKTTMVHALLKNGFEIVESSSCVDPANYNEDLGKDICIRRIKDQVWSFLGFLLQTARYGIKR